MSQNNIKTMPGDGAEPRNHGARNLMILAILTILISLGLTSVSLAVYHYSGDIYLDRSRPGFLPDDKEVETEEENEEGDYDFEKGGPITKEVLEEYLKKMQIEINALNDYKDTFDPEALSDSVLFGL